MQCGLHISCKLVFKQAESLLLGSIVVPKGTCVQVPKNAGPANTRLTFAFTCPRLNIYPCPYFIPKCRYYLEWSEWRRVSKCFKPCTYSQSKQFGEQQRLFKIPHSDAVSQCSAQSHLHFFFSSNSTFTCWSCFWTSSNPRSRSSLLTIC